MDRITERHVENGFDWGEHALVDFCEGLTGESAVDETLRSEELSKGFDRVVDTMTPGSFYKTAVWDVLDDAEVLARDGKMAEAEELIVQAQGVVVDPESVLKLNDIQPRIDKIRSLG